MERWNFRFMILDLRLTPFSSPLHRGRNECGKPPQCNKVACPPLSKGELEGVVFLF